MSQLLGSKTYVAADGSVSFTGAVGGVAATSTSQIPISSQIVGALGSTVNLATGHTAGAANANTYTNNTGRHLWVSFSGYSSSVCQQFGYINGVPVSRIDVGANSTNITQLLVPVGATYAIGFSAGTPTTTYWMEF